MKILVTGSAGHLGEALVRSLRAKGAETIGLDLNQSEYTDIVGTLTDRALVREAVAGCFSIFHTATLHKPHVGTHSRQAFVDTNISATLNLLEEAVEGGCQSFVYTSTTSTFGDAMRPRTGAATVWVTEELRPQPRNIYGVTKTAAEDLCRLFHRNTGLPCIVLKTSRFFPEVDDMKAQRDAFADANLKVNELLYRRVDIADIVSAHLLAAENAHRIGYEKLILTATTPFSKADAGELAVDVPSVLARYVPEYVEEFARRGWRMFQSIDRVYDNTRARQVLGWEPEYSFGRAIELLKQDLDYRSELTRQIGMKGYHAEKFDDGPYPVSSF